MDILQGMVSKFVSLQLEPDLRQLIQPPELEAYLRNSEYIFLQGIGNTIVKRLFE